MRLLLELPGADPRYIGALLGFDWDPKEPSAPEEPPSPPAHLALEPQPEVRISTDPPRAWKLVTSTSNAPLPGRQETRDKVDLSILDTPGSLDCLPPTPPIAPWARLEEPLRAALNARSRGQEVDMPQAVALLSEARPLDPIPREERSAWPAMLHLWLDGSPRHQPVMDDQLRVARELRRLLGARTIRWQVVGERHLPPGQVHGDPDLPAGSVVLVLGDLGITADRMAEWVHTGQALRARGVHAVALLPVALARVPPQLACWWTLVPWQAEAAVVDPGPAVERLLICTSPARLLQPGLLRAIRQCLSPREADIGTELDLWQDARVGCPPRSGAALEGDLCGQLRERFATEVDPALQARIRSLVHDWHKDLPREVLHAETLAWVLTPGLKGEPPGDPRAARAWLRALRQGLEGPRSVDRAELELLGRGLVSALPDAALRDEDVRAVYARVAARELRGRARIPESELIQPESTGAWWSIRQVGRVLRLFPSPQVEDPVLQPLRPGSPIGRVQAGSHVQAGGQRLLLEPGLELALPQQERMELDFGFERVALECGEMPGWAQVWGRDRFGLWADASIHRVVQRFRWIPPGRFLMGSPESEAGRDDDEVQHPVILTQGFWLGDTPVTQALWSAVMGRNPSYFQSPQRPVEQVSWNTALDFLDELDEDIYLPTEAEWEYACRAGTSTATWRGDLDIRGEIDAPILHDIAWYGGNSGLGFELDNGWDSSRWPKKQFDHTRAGTREVKGKAANPWGLYDMLGNVYEWCQDGWSEYDARTEVDPVHEGTASLRVFRGGAWLVGARYCRAAFRSRSPPSFEWYDLGFRLARGPQPASRRAALRQERQERSGAGGAEPAGTSDERLRTTNLPGTGDQESDPHKDLREVLEPLLLDLAYQLMNGDDIVVGAIAETNAFGWSPDTVEVVSIRHEELETVAFEAQIHLYGEQDPERPFCGTRVEVQLQGTASRETGTWQLLDWDVQSAELDW